MLSRTDAEGKTTMRNEYNLFGDLIRATDGNDNVIENLYNYGGGTDCASCSGSSRRKIVEKIFPTFTRKYLYDLKGRRIEEIDVLSETEAEAMLYEFDDVGNQKAIVDKAGKRTVYEYDALNRLIVMVDAASGRTEYTYDSMDNLIALNDANGHVTAFEYDRNNRLIKETRPMGEATTYAYDPAGNLKEKIDAKNQRTEYIYNEAGRITEKRYYSDASDINPVKTVVFNYDDVGNMKFYDDGTTSAVYSYDKNNRKLNETVDFGDFSLGHSYTYYANGLKQTFTGPDGITYSYSYDENNQLTTVNLPGSGDITFENENWNRTTKKVYPGGTTQHIQYDPLMRIKGIVVKSLLNGTIMLYSYTYDPAGNINENYTEHGKYSYGYDDRHQLISVDNPDFEDESFSYDPVGNRKTSSDTIGVWRYNNNDELEEFDDTLFNYDNNENLVRKTIDRKVINYDYNIQNRLVRLENSSDGLMVSYFYDPFGRRLGKVVNGKALYFCYSGEGLIGEYDSQGNEITSYSYKPGSVFASTPIFFRQNKKYYFYCNDQLDTPQKAIDIKGDVNWSATYKSFGKAYIEQGSAIKSNLRFPGQYFDEETGFHYNWNRYYDSSLGRYLRADPIGIDGGINLYIYGQNNPLINKDINGLKCWSQSIDKMLATASMGLTCSLCLIPGEGAGIGDILQCLACAALIKATISTMEAEINCYLKEPCIDEADKNYIKEIQKDLANTKERLKKIERLIGAETSS